MEDAVESLFFKYEQVSNEKQADSDENKLVTLDMGKSEDRLASGLTFSAGGAMKRRLTFEKDSLALRALNEG